MEVVRFGFEKMDLVRIQARCFVENIGSARVMEETGMSFEGIIRKGMFVTFIFALAVDKNTEKQFITY